MQEHVKSRSIVNGRLVTIMVTFLLVVAAVLYYYKNAAAKVGHSTTLLQCAEPHFDYGILPQGAHSHLQHTFTVTNGSSTTVRIGRVVSSCGCTVAELPTRAIAPRQTFKMQVKTEWRGRSGQQQSSVVLYSDHQEQLLVVTVAGFIEQAAALSRTTIDFGYVVPGENPEMTFDVVPGQRANKAVESIAVKTTNDLIEVRRISSNAPATEVSPAKFGVRVHVPHDPEADIFGNILVTVSNGEHPMTVRVHARSVGELQCVPRSVVLRPGQSRVSIHLASHTMQHAAPVMITCIPQSLSNDVTCSTASKVLPDSGSTVINVGTTAAGTPLNAGHLHITVGDASIDIPVVSMRNRP